MDIAFEPPVVMLLVIVGILVVAVIAVLLKRMQPWKRILTIGLAVVVCGALTFFLYRTSHLIVDDQGIRTDTYGSQSIAWTEVRAVTVVADLKSSPYALTMRTNGAAVGDYHAGWFRMANGQTAFVTTELPDRAIVIEGDGRTFVFGPKEFDAFVAAVAKHVSVHQQGGGAS